MDNDIHVLLVDDEVDFTATLSKRLHRQGIQVSCAANAEEGFSSLEQAPVDVVLLDLNMPGIDGMQALKTIKLNFPAVEVIILTGRAQVGAAVEAMYAGAFDFLVKPIPLDLVLCKIRDAALAARIGPGAVTNSCHGLKGE